MKDVSIARERITILVFGYYLHEMKYDVQIYTLLVILYLLRARF